MQDRHKSLSIDELEAGLWALALEAVARAYAPYSHFHVGAALLCPDGSIVTAANVENRSYGLGICAERCAVVKALSLGQGRYLAVAIATPDAAYPVGPCGACRQVLSEFMEAGAGVIFGSAKSALVKSSIAELLPFDSLYELKGEN